MKEGRVGRNTVPIQCLYISLSKEKAPSGYCSPRPQVGNTSLDPSASLLLYRGSKCCVSLHIHYLMEAYTCFFFSGDTLWLVCLSQGKELKRGMTVETGEKYTYMYNERTNGFCCLLRIKTPALCHPEYKHV